MIVAAGPSVVNGKSIGFVKGKMDLGHFKGRAIQQSTKRVPDLNFKKSYKKA